jgi:hypothetical protein
VLKEVIGCAASVACMQTVTTGPLPGKPKKVKKENIKPQVMRYPSKPKLGRSSATPLLSRLTAY